MGFYVVRNGFLEINVNLELFLVVNMKFQRQTLR